MSNRKKNKIVVEYPIFSLPIEEISEKRLNTKFRGFIHSDTWSLYFFLLGSFNSENPRIFGILFSHQILGMEEKREALEHLYMMLKRFSKENDQDFNKILDIAIEIEPFFYRCSLTEKDINFFEHAYSVDRIHLENVEGLLREMLFHEARSCIHDFKNDTLFQLQEKIPLIYKDKPWILTQDLIQELTDDISGIFDPKYRVKMAEQSVLLCMPKFSSMKVH